ncbi:MAG: carbamoyltransferase HypF [Myxococcota bacterium]
MPTERIRIRGTVQGVGFRPTVARLAQNRGLNGFVRNDSDGVLIELDASPEDCSAFLEELMASLPPLARVDDVHRTTGRGQRLQHGFHIVESQRSTTNTDIPPDAASCPDCISEVMDPYERRYRYPFATCTHCGPRFSMTESLPLDRGSTTMKAFDLCSDCQREYETASDRRYHAQPIACHVCGPRATLQRTDGRAFSIERYSMMDAVDAVGSLLQQGEIVAVKGIGGFHLCCDATNEHAVSLLRARKRRAGKPFALMARDLDTIRRYVVMSDKEREILESAAAPIVLLGLKPDGESVAPSVAPAQRTLGFMLPYTPLHHLMLTRVQKPIVCTSGNVSDEPQCIDDEDAQARLSSIADWMLVHDRPIRNRVDDSVVRVCLGTTQVMRRARGMAPHSVVLPSGLSRAALWAAGAQLKSTFCLSQGGRAIVSPHLGDLDELKTLASYEHQLSLMQGLFEHRPRAVAVDLHPEIRATQIGRAWAQDAGAQVIEVQHHHAHIAAVMAEHGLPADTEAVLGIAADGLGMGSDDELWGGEFMLADYRSYQRVGTFKPVALLGGDAAARQPWRNLYAHLRAEQSWGELLTNFGDLPVVQDLAARSQPLEAVLASAALSPRSSSCGRLFDAVAHAVGIAPDHLLYEGQAAIELEALVGSGEIDAALGLERYPIGIPKLDNGLPYLEFLGLWRAILGDLHTGTAASTIAARFHVALAEAMVRLADMVGRRHGHVRTAVLGGGCFQNRILLSLVVEGLRKAGFRVLFPERFPAHDGGLSLGQAAIAAARLP